MKRHVLANRAPGFFNAEYLLIPAIHAIYFAALLPCASRLGHRHGGWLLALLLAPILCQAAAYLFARWRGRVSHGPPQLLAGSLLLLVLKVVAAICASVVWATGMGP